MRDSQRRIEGQAPLRFPDLDTCLWLTEQTALLAHAQRDLGQMVLQTEESGPHPLSEVRRNGAHIVMEPHK